MGASSSQPDANANCSARLRLFLSPRSGRGLRQVALAFGYAVTPRVSRRGEEKGAVSDWHGARPQENCGARRGAESAIEGDVRDLEHGYGEQYHRSECRCRRLAVLPL